ncbi:hypothetical protein QBC43DRAFT_346837 [Cladorrhinum sp. PSN259]|nr:hypothetical protein QBC43DRAFT_346837 [Cladorrhinum sp. PSN259]
MTVRILLIGGTGHIGAAVLEVLKNSNLGTEILALVRSNDDIEHTKNTYNNEIHAKLGSLSDIALLKEEAAAAQIIINCAPDMGSEPGISALLSGLDASPATHKFYIGTSGASRIWAPPDPTKPGDRIWDDLDDLSNFPTDATHAESDILVQNANTSSLHTAIISPSFVIGKSPSRNHAAPITFPDWHHVTRSTGGGWTIGPGANMTTFVDTADLAELYLLLVKDALPILNESTAHAVIREEVWGPQAYYFAGSFEVSIREFVEKEMIPALKRNEVTKEWIKYDGVKELGLEEVVNGILTRLGGTEGADLWSRHIAEGFGTSMRVRGRRGGRYLGWKTGGKVDLDAAVSAYVDHVVNHEGKAEGV